MAISSTDQVQFSHNLSRTAQPGDGALRELLRPTGRLRLPHSAPVLVVSTVPLSSISPIVIRGLRRRRQSTATPDHVAQVARQRHFPVLGVGRLAVLFEYWSTSALNPQLSSPWAMAVLVCVQVARKVARTSIAKLPSMVSSCPTMASISDSS